MAAETSPLDDAGVALAPASFASVIVDIPARALSEPFAYAVPSSLADDMAVGCTVLVAFGHRPALGYVVALADTLAALPGTESLEASRVRPIDAVLAPPSCSDLFGPISFWMSREYVAPLAECVRLFLPPGGTPRLLKGEDGSYRLERAATPEVHARGGRFRAVGTGDAAAAAHRGTVVRSGDDARTQPALHRYVGGCPRARAQGCRSRR